MPTTCLSVLPIAAPLSDMQNRHFANSMRVHAIVSPDYLVAPENKGVAKTATGQTDGRTGLHFANFVRPPIMIRPFKERILITPFQLKDKNWPGRRSY